MFYILQAENLSAVYFYLEIPMGGFHWSLIKQWPKPVKI